MPESDPISGALNFPLFGQKFGEALDDPSNKRLALWYLDIRNFRSVNPKFGYLSGNMVLSMLVDGIRNFLSKDLPVARLGGDRFIFLSGNFTFENAEKAFYEMVDSVTMLLMRRGINHALTLNAGIYFMRKADYESRIYSQALDYASIAHRKARQDVQSNLVLFSDEDLARDMHRVAVEQSIDQALIEGQLEVWYQPQVDYTYGEVIGAEALVRWRHPELGWLNPDEFIPILENCGRVHDLDLFVWEEACRNASRWRSAADGNPLSISVNVSRTEMLLPGLVDHFKLLCEKYNLPPRSLRLEITESAFGEQGEKLFEVIERLRENGMIIEMDDFGSGHSSLHMLKDVPVDVVKLDMGFIHSLSDEDRGGVVLSSVIRMLQGLDTPIIAEGVETLEQAEMLKNMGCRLMQGFHFSRPLELHDFEQFVMSARTVDSIVTGHWKDSSIDNLLSFDSTSSFLFNHAVGGMILFFTDGESSESLLVNDQFYIDCGLPRDQFGYSKVNPIMEIDPETRDTMWRAAAEARENGSAMVTAAVRSTNRLIECVMRFISDTARGALYSLIIVRSGELLEDDLRSEAPSDLAWDFAMLDKIVPNGFIKCDMRDGFRVEYISPVLLESSGVDRDEFVRRFHQSLADIIVLSDRRRVVEAIRRGEATGEIIEEEFNIYHGFNNAMGVHMIASVKSDDSGVPHLYALIMLRGVVDDEGDDMDRSINDSAILDRIIPFDLFLETGTLVIYTQGQGGEVDELRFENWLDKLDEAGDSISPMSISKILATIRDLRSHPISGFSDLKLDLRGRGDLRWFHVNYTCDADANGETRVIHGYAQDADDQMGSVKWWRRQAEKDYLTGLSNRNAVEQEVNVAMRAHGCGMMFMIDLDNFKRVNDEMGHLSGDALLRYVAEALSARFRDGDVLGRYGGDEFVAFMPVSNGSEYELAKRRARDIIDAIGAIENPDGTHAACSIGIAVSHDENATFYDLLEVADQAMYKSKEGGKGIYTILDLPSGEKQ